MTTPAAPAVAPRVLLPRDCARALGIEVPALVAIIREYRYPFTELVPGGKPGDRGRKWGLTPAQLDAIVRAQARQFDPPAAEPDTAGVAGDGWDGVRRVRRK